LFSLRRRKRVIASRKEIASLQQEIADVITLRKIRTNHIRRAEFLFSRFVPVLREASAEPTKSGSNYGGKGTSRKGKKNSDATGSDACGTRIADILNAAMRWVQIPNRSGVLKTRIEGMVSKGGHRFGSFVEAYRISERDSALGKGSA
jgi:hypothetical protein